MALFLMLAMADYFLAPSRYHHIHHVEHVG